MRKKQMMKVFALALAAALCVGFVGCGKNKTAESKDVVEETLAAEETESLEVEEETEELTVESTEEFAQAMKESDVLEEEESEATEETETVETDTSDEKAEDVTKETTDSRKETAEETLEQTKEPVKETAKNEETKPQTQESKPVESAPQTSNQQTTQQPTTPQASQPQTQPTAPTPTPEPTPAPEEQKPAEHVHSLVEEVTEATCTTGKVITTKCSTCGHVEGTRTEGSGLGHDYNDIITAQPTCYQDGYHNVVCKRCKATGEGHGAIPMLPHTYTTQVMREGNCKSPKVTKDVCTVCGHEEPYKEDWNAHANDHKWKTSMVPVWSDEAFAMVDVPRTFCEVCNMDKPE